MSVHTNHVAASSLVSVEQASLKIMITKKNNVLNNNKKKNVFALFTQIAGVGKYLIYNISIGIFQTFIQNSKGFITPRSDSLCWC